MTQLLAKKDVPASKAWLRALQMTANIEDAPARIFPVVIEELAARFGNIHNVVVGYRWYPIMISRGGLAWHQEYSWLRSINTAPLSGLNVAGSSYLMGFDFAF